MLSQCKNIQVSVDGSKEADLAFSKAVAIAKRNNATLEILHVIDTRSFQNVSSFDSAMVEQVSKDAEKRMKDYQARAVKAGVKDSHYRVRQLGKERSHLLGGLIGDTVLCHLEAAQARLDAGVRVRVIRPLP